MKTRFILTLAMAVLAYSSFAQKSEMSRKLTRDEVPVVVVLSLQKDFSNVPDKGIWKLIYQEDMKTTRLTPEYYEYSYKKDGARIEIFYKPNGTFDHAKGIGSPTHTSQL